MQYAQIIKEIGRGAKGSRPIDQNLATELFAAILDGQVPDMELGAILLSLRIKGEALEEVIGFQTALASRCAQLEIAPQGPRCVILPTYNGARKHANLMPLVAQLLVKQGIPVLIQGRHDFDARISPFALLAELGIHPASDITSANAELAHSGLSCVPLPTLCAGLDRLLALRPRLGVRNSGHSAAKLIDPLQNRSVRVVAVTHPEYLERMEEFLHRQHATALLMRGTEGEAYASPRRRPRLLGFHQGQTQELFASENFEHEADLADACEIKLNAQLIRAMLAGERPIPQAILDQVSALTQLATC